MSARLFVGGLSWSTNADSLRAAFDRFGEVVDSFVVNDRETGRSKGYGFVTFNNEEEAKKAIDEMNQQELDGRTIRVDLANPKPERGDRPPRRDFGDRPARRYENDGERGGYGGDRGGDRYGGSSGGRGGYGEERRSGGYEDRRRSPRRDDRPYDRPPRRDRD